MEIRLGTQAGQLLTFSVTERNREAASASDRTTTPPPPAAKSSTVTAEEERAMRLRIRMEAKADLDGAVLCVRTMDVLGHGVPAVVASTRINTPKTSQSKPLTHPLSHPRVVGVQHM